MPKEGFTVMAQYNNEILVQYLDDVYSLELLCRKIQDKINLLATTISSREEFIHRADSSTVYPIQHVPHWLKTIKWSETLEHLIVLGIIIFVCTSIPDLITKILGFLFALVFVGGLYFDISEPIRNYNSDIKSAQEDYKSRVTFHNSQLKTAREYEASLSSLTRDRNDAITQLKRTQDELSTAYGVNIIPNKYRNIYAAYYLYDYFSSSRETDLDKILQTMLLDKIVDKLDHIISQQQDIILNQRMTMAIQEKQSEQFQQSHLAQMQSMARIEKNQQLQNDSQKKLTEQLLQNRHAQMESIARMEKNQQLQNDYLAMIDTNARTTNYFVTADYINKYL